MSNSLSIDEMIQKILEIQTDAERQEVDGTYFFFVPGDKMFPFVTIVTSDSEFDAQSQLDRQGVYRLNIGVKKETFLSMFGPLKQDDGHELDYSVLNEFIPHPVYKKMYWLSIINPTSDHLAGIKQLATEAYEIQHRRFNRRAKD